MKNKKIMLIVGAINMIRKSTYVICGSNNILSYVEQIFNFFNNFIYKNIKGGV